jgi:hypothetical protein
MISIFAVFPRFSGSLFIKGCLAGFVTVSAIGLWAQQDDPNRPRISHQSQPIAQDATSNEPLDAVSSTREDSPAVAAGTQIGDGLVLPSTGHVWAVDTFGGVRQLVQMKYVPTDIDRHAGSNMLKTNLAPFVYKQKQSVEIQGAAANLRLHDPNIVIYARGYGSANEDAAPSSDNSSARMELALVRLESRKDRRVVSTIAFTQITGNAKRNSQVIDITIEKLGNTDWQRITSKTALSPGEYALMPMPHGQDLFATAIFDFAIDPTAPANPNAIVPVGVTSSKE